MSKETTSFETQRNGTRFITKQVADYSFIKSYLEKNSLHYYFFSPNYEKPIKEVILHLLPDTPAKDISNSLQDLGFNVINVNQMTAQLRNPRGL
jgi:hypothetical protein